MENKCILNVKKKHKQGVFICMQYTTMFSNIVDKKFLATLLQAVLNIILCYTMLRQTFLLSQYSLLKSP